MATKRATYTPEFKLQAVQMVTEQKLSVAEAARRHEWKKALLKGGTAASPGSGRRTPLEEELRRLRADVKRLEMERDILKKAAALRRRAGGPNWSPGSARCPPGRRAGTAVRGCTPG